MTSVNQDSSATQNSGDLPPFPVAKVPPIRLTTAPMYRLDDNPKWNNDPRFAPHNWFHSAWCRLSEVVDLVNRHYGLSWTPVKFLENFAIPLEDGQVIFGASGNKRYDLVLIHVEEDGNLSKKPFGRYDLAELVPKHADSVYLLAGWVADVLLALSQGAYYCFLMNGYKTGCIDEEEGRPIPITGEAALRNKKQIHIVP